MQELEITWSRVVSVWWLFFWRAAVGGSLLGGLVGFIIGFITGLLRIPLNPLLPGILGAIVGLVWVVFVLRMALRKKYKDFRIALLPL